jgi:hypothetical protein
MSGVNVSVPYQIAQDEALRRVRTSAAGLEMRYADKQENLRENSNGYGGSFSGSVFEQSFSRDVVVRPSDIVVELGLPVIAVVFKDTIEAVIRKH